MVVGINAISEDFSCSKFSSTHPRWKLRLWDLDILELRLLGPWTHLNAVSPFNRSDSEPLKFELVRDIFSYSVARWAMQFHHPLGRRSR